jgi:hypothetical protein
MGKLHECLLNADTSFVLYRLLPNVPTSKKHSGNRLSEKFFIGMFGNAGISSVSMDEIHCWKVVPKGELRTEEIPALEGSPKGCLPTTICTKRM